MPQVTGTAANGNTGQPTIDILLFDNGAGGPKAGGTVLVNSDAVPISPATEATLAALLSRTPINANGVPFVSTARAKFRDAFLTYDTVNNWQTIQTGSGQAITVAGATGGSRYLNIASGVTANAETIILSRLTFKAPCSVIVGLSMSQRIVNCDAYVEIVEVDPLTGAVVTDTTIPSPAFLNAANAAGWRFNGTVATTQTIQVRQDGLSEESAALAFVTTAATGTGPNFIQAGNYEITLRTRDLQFSSTTVNGVAPKVAPTGSLRNTRVPNPDATYALRIRLQNGAVAPASTTDLRIHSVTVLDDTRMTVDFGSISGVALPQNSAPVQVVNTPAVDTELPAAAALSDAIANPTAPMLGAAAMLFNGTTFERARGNVVVTAEASSAKTATGAGAAQTNFNARGALLFLNVSAASGTTPTLDVRVQVQDPISLAWFDLPGAAFPQRTAVSTAMLEVYPGLVDAANVRVGRALPRTWRLAWTLGGTTPSFTFSVGVQYVL